MQSRTYVRALIDGRGLRHGWVARQAGLSPSALSLWLSGKRRLRPERLEALARVLQVPVELLQDGEDRR
jgi:transcriptional regulator with XRE-family HTH domain